MRILARIRRAAIRTLSVETVDGGATASASADGVSTSIVWIAKPGSPVSEVVWDASNAVVDSLLVEIVRMNVAGASDEDLLAALGAADRGGDREVGDLRLEAIDRGLIGVPA